MSTTLEMHCASDYDDTLTIEAMSDWVSLTGRSNGDVTITNFEPNDVQQLVDFLQQFLDSYNED